MSKEDWEENKVILNFIDFCIKNDPKLKVHLEVCFTHFCREQIKPKVRTGP